jgi:hypothetical protein
MSTSQSPKFRTPEEAELARQLGFSAPQNPVPAPPKGQTTNVVGYFNSNPWPVHIAISALGISLHIPNRGEYVKDAEGNKVNDPILEQYVGPGQLSRETSSTPIPIRMFVRPGLHPEVRTSSIHTASAFVQTPSGVQPVILNPRDEMPQLPENRASCVGMSMEQARKLKLVRPMVDPRTQAPKDTDGQPSPGELLPTLEDATPRDMRPSEYQAWVAAQRAQGKPVTPTVVPVNVPPPSARPVANVVREPEDDLPPTEDELDRPTDEVDVTVPAAAVIESPEQAVIQKTLVEAASNKAVMHDAVAAALGSSPRVATPVAAPVATPVVPPPDPEANLPRPNLAAPAPEAQTPPAQRPKFVCSVDGKPFDYRSQLEAYAKRKHPTRVEEIMAPYPKVR